jgi:hypothetical protein
MKKTVTPRGFSLIEFADTYGDQCSLQASSNASEACVWLGRDGVKPVILSMDAGRLGLGYGTAGPNGWVDFKIPPEVKIHSRMHLNRSLAKQLIKHLQKFVDTGIP